MIPVLIVLGLVLGRWWRTTLVVGTVAWPVVLLATDVIGTGGTLAAAGLALANTGLGVLVHQVVLHGLRRRGGGTRHPQSA